MPAQAGSLDLAALGVGPGEGRRLELVVGIDPLRLGAERYNVEPRRTPVRLEVSHLTGPGWALRLRIHTTLRGPCMRCLKDATLPLDVDAREVERPGAGEELESPYVDEEILRVSDWARDALMLTLPAQVLCRAECLGLCPVCAADLSEAGAQHHHDSGPDPRWAKLRELRLG